MSNVESPVRKRQLLDFKLVTEIKKDPRSSFAIQFKYLLLFHLRILYFLQVRNKLENYFYAVRGFLWIQRVLSLTRGSCVKYSWSAVWITRTSLSGDVKGSLRNDNGDAVDNIDYTMNLYFTFESHNTLKSFSLFLTVKTISIMNMERSVKLEI